MAEFEEGDKVVIITSPPPVGRIVCILDNFALVRWPSGVESIVSLGRIKKASEI